MHIGNRFLLTLACVMLLGNEPILSTDVKAFPEAEGFGSNAKGGRGGAVLIVSNLNDSGPGSFRNACEAKGPRIVVFRVSGIIELKSPLTIVEPFITIAGQTAPGEGITIKNYGCVIEKTHDVVLRYLRFRPGDLMRVEQDALTVSSSSQVIIDHCSTSWGTDETLSVVGGGTTNVTVQWSIISESLNNSIHHKGEHGYGSLIRIDGNVSFHHNLFASHDSRNPRPGCYGDAVRGGVLDFRNNVIYNWGSRPGYNDEDKVSMNYIANYLQPGPSTARGVRRYAFLVESPFINMFVDGNVLEGHPEGSSDNWKLIRLADPSWKKIVQLPLPLSVAAVNTEGAADAMKAVLAQGGASLPGRDGIDERIVQDFFEKRGRIIDSQADVGGWIVHDSAEPPPDSDEDGMPDTWELDHGLNPQNAEDATGDTDLDGYTNIEEFLNATDPRTRNR